eukprot:gene34386-25599_t
MWDNKDAPAWAREMTSTTPLRARDEDAPPLPSNADHDLMKPSPAQFGSPVKAPSPRLAKFPPHASPRADVVISRIVTGPQVAHSPRPVATRTPQTSPQRDEAARDASARRAQRYVRDAAEGPGSRHDSRT